MVRKESITLLLNYYINNCLGYYPAKEKVNIITNVIEYLLDCEFSNEEIMDVFDTQENFEQECFTFDMLPDFLWQDSLLKKNTYYMHHSLHLYTVSDSLDIMSENITMKTSNAVEMIIKYTLKDALSYFCNAFNLRSNDLDTTKELGAINHLIETFNERYPDLNAIDIFLYLVDEVANSDRHIYAILDLCNSIYPVVVRLRQIDKELTFSNANVIVWR